MERTSLGFPPLTMAVFVGLAITAMAIVMFSHRGNKPITLAEASAWSFFWVAISLAFAGLLFV
ncbi:tellurium resistance protein TerC, partial [Pseudomonas syringae pv. tagetis]